MLYYDLTDGVQLVRQFCFYVDREKGIDERQEDEGTLQKNRVTYPSEKPTARDNTEINLNVVVCCRFIRWSVHHPDI